MIGWLMNVIAAARMHGIDVLDGVYNNIGDAEGFVKECEQGRDMGFDGKTLIHPNQIDAANRVFGASDAEIEEARALVAAATGGAQRFRDRMIEAMHVDAAKRLLARAG
jgi:citrate lyase subunit beta/citryl-CoA lyase